MRTRNLPFPIILSMMVAGLVLLASCRGKASETGEGRETEGITSGTGTVKFIDLEGGFYGIVGDDGRKYDPMNLSPQFREDGLRIRFEARIRRDVASFHMWGTIVDIITIEKLEPMAPKAGMGIKLYYYNRTKAEEIGDSCSTDAILPVERELPATKTPIPDAIRLLIEGKLTEQEKAAGFYTEFPLVEFGLLSANLRDGVLTLKFTDPASKTVGGSCRVRLLWAQIQKTAKQFPEVKEVRFEPEELFQP